MLRLLANENFNGDNVRGLLVRQPDLDFVRGQDVGLSGATDPKVLAWAGENDHIILTHDWATMLDHAYARVAAGEPMSGVFIINDRFPIGQDIQEVLLLALCTEQSEWRNLAIYIPLET